MPINSLNTIILTYPRQGSNYVGMNLNNLFRSNKMSDIRRSHEIKDAKGYDYIISLVRNPLDTITSELCQAVETKDFVGDSRLWIERLKRFDAYIETYEFLMQQPNLLLIDFEDLKNDHDKVFDYLTKYLNIKSFKEAKVKVVSPPPTRIFTPTSTWNPKYDEVKEKLSKSHQLNQANISYNNLYKRIYEKIDIDRY